ncbi:MAG: hypothetical protein ACSHX6_10205 [Akkermansiaceae bacterium]
MKTINIILGISLGLTSMSFGVIPFEVETDSSGSFTQGNYTGDGVVQTDVEAGDFANGVKDNLLVEGLTSGTLSFDTTSVSRILTEDLVTTFNVSFSGGSGDLYVANSADYDDGALYHNSVGFSGLTGVTAINLTINYSEFLAGRNSSVSSATSRPLLAALGLVDAGAGLGLSNFDVDMSIGNAVYSLNGTDFTAGGPNVASFASDAWETPTGGGLNYSDVNGFSELVGLGGNSDGFLLVRGFDFDGNGYDTTDATKFYADTMTWTITPGDGAATFSEDTHFVFSLDGQQYSNVENVPEPSVSLLSALSALMALSFRRRN